jgi:hypothetical protein
LFWLFWRAGLGNYWAGLALNQDPPDLASQVARIPGVSHWCLAGLCFLLWFGLVLVLGHQNQNLTHARQGLYH